MLAEIEPCVDHRATLAVYRTGRGDPTTRLGANEFWRSTWTPHDGPATMHIWWTGERVDAEAWGPGASWLLDRVPSMLGTTDHQFRCPDNADEVVRASFRNHPGLRIGASATLYHELLPVILAQRITGGQAVQQWRRLCLAIGEHAPGPNADMRLPPSPGSLIARPPWWYHPFGIESKRAGALRTVARFASRIAEWSQLAPSAAADKLALLRGVGPWTIGSALGPALGDANAVPVGDYHIPNMVAWALAGEARATDERMLQLLAPYAGQRGRVIRLLAMNGHAAPAFGPRQRILPMHRW